MWYLHVGPSSRRIYGACNARMRFDRRVVGGSSDARPFVERMACIIESFFVSGPGTERLWSTQSDGRGNHLGPGSAIFIVAEDSPMRRLD